MADYTILIADYDPKTTAFATEVFEAAEFDVHVAKDGLKAVEAFKKYRPLLTLIEFMMPKKAGLEVCRDLRHSAEGRDAHLVVMSSPFRGRAFRADAVRVYGATETVEKPLDSEKLEGLLERLVRPRIAELLAATPQAGPDPPPAALQTARPAVPTASDMAPPLAPAAFETAPSVAPAAAPPPASLPLVTPQDEATAQALRDVVSAVLGPQALVEAGVGVGFEDPSIAAGQAQGDEKTQPAPQSGAAATAPFRPSVTEEAAGETEIEDHIDSLLDF